MDAVLSARGARKAADFVKFCDAFNIPVLTLTNVTGFKATKCSEANMAKAVAELFGVKVAKVNTMNVNGRYRRQGLNGGYTADWKKAIVTLTEDSKSIEFFDSMM